MRSLHHEPHFTFRFAADRIYSGPRKLDHG